MYENIILITLCLLTVSTIYLLIRIFNKLKKNMLLYNLYIVIMFIIIVITIFEFIFRFMYVGTDSLLLMKNTEKWSEKYENIRTVNNIKEKNEILILGDSFVYGYGLNDKEKTVPYIIDRLLPLSVYSTAMPGNDLEDYERLLTGLSSNSDIKYVIMGYFYNDLGDSIITMKIRDKMIPFNSVKKWVVEYSYFLNFIYYAYQYKRKDIANDYLNMLYSDFSKKIYIAEHENSIKRIKALSDSIGAKLIIIEYPLMTMINCESFSDIRKQVNQIFNRNNIQYIDMSGILNSYSIKQLTVNAFDSHPSYLVNSIAADTLISIILNYERTNKNN